MKKILSNAKVAFILLLITGILLNGYINVITRPVSYGCLTATRLCTIATALRKQ